MNVNVKMLNGDLIAMEMPVYCENTVKRNLRSMFGFGWAPTGLKIVEKIEEENEENIEKKENKEEKKEKTVFAIALPVHKRGKEFIMMMKQFIEYSYEQFDTTDGSLSEKWLQECHACAAEEKYVSFVEKKPEDLLYYFEQLPRFLAGEDGEEDGIRGDTYVTEKEMALFAFTDMLLKCKGDDIFFCRFIPEMLEQLCKTINQETLKIIVWRMIKKLTHSTHYEFLYDFVADNNFEIRAKILLVIQTIVPSLFDEFKDVKDLKESISGYHDNLLEMPADNVTTDMVKSLLKFYMEKDNAEEDD